jgi:hypothetical protein
MEPESVENEESVLTPCKDRLFFPRASSTPPSPLQLLPSLPLRRLEGGVEGVLDLLVVAPCGTPEGQPCDVTSQLEQNSEQLMSPIHLSSGIFHDFGL